MKILKSSLLLIALFLTIANLQTCKDDCEVVCENGGKCIDETCICPAGFYGDFCEKETLQHRLDSGETPLELYNNNVPLDSLYGKMYAGGLIFYLNTDNGTGMVAATMDQTPVGNSGCCSTWGKLQFTTGATGKEIGDGANNTITILNEYDNASINAQGLAAKLCDDLDLNGYEDWFLPSKEELELIWENLVDSDGDDQNNGPGDAGNLGGFYANVYWSSTEHNENNAWKHRFEYGVRSPTLKTNFGHVRATRAF